MFSQLKGPLGFVLRGNNLTSFLAFLGGLGLLGEAWVQPGGGLAVVAEVEERKTVSCDAYFLFLEGSATVNERVAGESLLARSSGAASASKQSNELLRKLKCCQVVAFCSSFLVGSNG